MRQNIGRRRDCGIHFSPYNLWLIISGSCIVRLAGEMWQAGDVLGICSRSLDLWHNQAVITRYFTSHSGHALSSFYFPVLRFGLLMGSRKDLSKDDIASSINLYKVKTPTNDIAKIVGVSERTVQVWTKRFWDAGQLVTPHHKEHLRKARKTSHPLICMQSYVDLL